MRASGFVRGANKAMTWHTDRHPLRVVDCRHPRHRVGGRTDGEGIPSASAQSSPGSPGPCPVQDSLQIKVAKRVRRWMCSESDHHDIISRFSPCLCARASSRSKRRRSEAHRKQPDLAQLLISTTSAGIRHIRLHRHSSDPSAPSGTSCSQPLGAGRISLSLTCESLCLEPAARRPSWQRPRLSPCPTKRIPSPRTQSRTT